MFRRVETHETHFFCVRVYEGCYRALRRVPGNFVTLATVQVKNRASVQTSVQTFEGLFASMLAVDHSDTVRRRTTQRPGMGSRVIHRGLGNRGRMVNTVTKKVRRRSGTDWCRCVR